MVQKPTIYLYGKDQMPLPKLPTWDKETHPCAVVVYGASENFVLLVSDSFSCNGPSLNLYTICGGENFSLTDYKKYVIHGTGFVEAEVTPANDCLAYNIIWSNCNLYRYDAFNGITDELMFGKDDDPVLDETDRPYVLCNGMLLPVLPDFVRGKVVIFQWLDGATTLFDSSTEFELDSRNDDGSLYFSNDDAQLVEYQYTCTGAGWMRMPRHEGTGGNTSFSGEIIWSNHDIIDANGTVGEVGSIYFPKSSDPVPFEPEPQLNPAALMQGFFVGQAIRRNRK